MGLGLAGACALAVAAGARVEEIPNFGYVYGMTSGSYLISDTATGKGYRGSGRMTGQRWQDFSPDSVPGPLVVGQLVKNSRFRPRTVHGTLVPMFKMSVQANEVYNAPDGTTLRCPWRETSRYPLGVTVRLSVYPSADRVLARYRLYGPLGEKGNCSPSIAGRLNFEQWFPLEPFTRESLTVTLQGSAIVESSRGDRHSLKWRVVVNLVRLRSLLPPRP